MQHSGDGRAHASGPPSGASTVDQIDAGGRPMVGVSESLRQVFGLVARVAPSAATVLVTGESGTGKELVARALHSGSSRAGGPFIAVNCGAIPEALQESELFGHARGSFTGAIRDRAGYVEQAAGGTLFLDEIGETDPRLQVQLLRFLQEGEFRRVGETRTREASTRIVAATHRDLRRDVDRGRFRQDLFYRLAVIRLHIPALRDRRADILPLAEHFRRRLAGDSGAPTGFDRPARQLLLDHSWPGNVRELENAIERAVALARGDTIGVADLPPALAESRPDSGGGGPHVPQIEPRLSLIGPEGGLRSLAQIERDAIFHAMQVCDGHRGRVAAELGLSKTTLWRKLRAYGWEG